MWCLLCIRLCEGVLSKVSKTSESACFVGRQLCSAANAHFRTQQQQTSQQGSSQHPGENTLPSLWYRRGSAAQFPVLVDDRLQREFDPLAMQKEDIFCAGHTSHSRLWSSRTAETYPTNGQKDRWCSNRTSLAVFLLSAERTVVYIHPCTHSITWFFQRSEKTQLD